jgi:hypothetical protein
VLITLRKGDFMKHVTQYETVDGKTKKLREEHEAAETKKTADAQKRQRREPQAAEGVNHE